MAKRKKKYAGVKHHRPRHHRRVGAPGDMMQDAEMLIGLVGGSLAATIVQRQVTSFNPKIVSGIQIVGGILLKNKFPGAIMQGVGYGVAGAGAIGIAHEFGVIKGIEEACEGMFSKFPPMMPAGGQPVMIDHNMSSATSGIGNEDMLSGIDNESMLSGLENEAMLSGHEGDDSYAHEYETVESLGM